MKKKRKIAVIDLGTNTFHLLVAEISGKNFDVLFKEKISVKIGQGGINQGVITEEGIVRALSALKEFHQIIIQNGISEVYATATSAIRNAKNGKYLTQLIKEQTNIDVRIISGEEEAELIYFGVKSAMDIRDETSLVMDIGGGSVEFIICNSEKIFWKKSFEIGVQRLVDIYHKTEPITKKEIKNLETYFTNTLTPLQQAINTYKPTVLIGASGTFDTLSDIYHLNNQIDKKEEDTEYTLPLDQFFPIYESIIVKNKEERLQIPGMLPMRSDMIVVACCLVNYLLVNFEFNHLRVSSFALKEGVLYSILNSLNLDIKK
jgi:exopolyphosphatase / guanosine-5'-triphosphate,3'-diphosphate pyrophosphatase